MTLTGADYSYDSATKKASVAIAEPKKVTINGAESNIISISGAAQVSQGGGVTNLIIADRTPKLSANFAVTPANVTLNALQPATISASRLGDGLIKCYDNASYFDINQLSATEFRFLGRKVATVNAGFWLDETEAYYPASKNVNIIVTQGGRIF